MTSNGLFLGYGPNSCIRHFKVLLREPNIIIGILEIYRETEAVWGLKKKTQFDKFKWTRSTEIIVILRLIERWQGATRDLPKRELCLFSWPELRESGRIWCQVSILWGLFMTRGGGRPVYLVRIWLAGLGLAFVRVKGLLPDEIYTFDTPMRNVEI